VLRFPAGIFPLVVVPVWCKLKFGPSVGPGSLCCRLAFAVTCGAFRATVSGFSRRFWRLRSLALGGACGLAASEFLVVSSVPPGAGEGSELSGRYGTSRAIIYIYIYIYIYVILSYSSPFPSSPSPISLPCQKGQQRQQALLILQVMPRQAIVPTVVTYCAAISACEYERYSAMPSCPK